MLLTDTHILDHIEILEESKSKGTMKIRGIFQRADEANNNKRIYSRPILEREVIKLAEAISERRLLGELDHPTHDAVKLSNVSHLVTGLKMEGKEVVGEAEILNTPSGKVAQALINDGVKIGISSRGMGTLSEDIKGNKTVNEDFKLITFDLVADPSTRGAFPQISEATSYRTQEIVDSTYKKARAEKVFVTLLRNKLDEATLATRVQKKKKPTLTPPFKPFSTADSDPKFSFASAENAPGSAAPATRFQKFRQRFRLGGAGPSLAIQRGGGTREIPHATHLIPQKSGLKKGQPGWVPSGSRGAGARAPEFKHTLPKSRGGTGLGSHTGGKAPPAGSRRERFMDVFNKEVQRLHGEEDRERARAGEGPVRTKEFDPEKPYNVFGMPKKPRRRFISEPSSRDKIEKPRGFWSRSRSVFQDTTGKSEIEDPDPTHPLHRPDEPEGIMQGFKRRAGVLQSKGRTEMLKKLTRTTKKGPTKRELDPTKIRRNQSWLR